MRGWLAALVALLSAPAMAETSHPTTMSVDGLRTGVIVGEADCPQAGAVWVTAPHADGTVEGTCIRYYAAGLAAENRTAIVFLHGNRVTRHYDAEGRVIRISAIAAYAGASEGSLRRAAALQAAALGHPFIILARPGYYGSSGIAVDQYRRREILLVNAALDAIRQRHRIERFGVSAQSGGGPSLGGILALRDDVPCAVFSSALTAFDERERALGARQQTPPLRQTTPEAYDPIREIAQIRPLPGRRIFVIGDEGDQSIPIAAQRAYAEALRQAGQPVTMAIGIAVGDAHHALGATGQRSVGWCLEGLPDAAIVMRIGRGEASYLIEGGFY